MKVIPDIKDKGEFEGKLDMLARQVVKQAVKLEQARKENGVLKNELNVTKNELKRIEFWENMLSPTYKQTKQFINTEDEISFHENRWLFFLNKRADDPLVKRLLEFMKSHENDGMSIKVFVRRISGFFHYLSNKIHVPPLESYTTGELKQELENFFGEAYDNLTFDVVCALRKETLVTFTIPYLQ